MGFRIDFWNSIIAKGEEYLGQCNRNDHLASCGYTGRVIIEKQLKQKKIPKIMFKNVFNILVKLQGTLTFNPIKFNPHFSF